MDRVRLVNFLVFMPAYVMIVYVWRYAFSSSQEIMTASIMALPFLSYISGSRYRGRVYLAYALALSLLVLNTVVMEVSPYSVKPFSSLVIPLDTQDLVSISLGASWVFVVEGVLSVRLARTVTLFTLAVGDLLEQSVAVALMASMGSSYLYAYATASVEEALSIYSLIVQGGQQLLPLANVHLPVTGYLLPAFIVSIGALAFLFYSHSDRSERSALMTGKAFLYGSAVAVITFLAYDYMERYGYQFMALGTAVLIIFVLLTVTSRRKAEFN